MRSLFVILFLANVALLALDRGWFGEPLAQRGREPARLKTEIRPDAIHVPRLPGFNATDEPAPQVPAPAAARVPAAPAIPPAPPAALPATNPNAAASCLEWGAFSEAELTQAKQWANAHLPGTTFEIRHEPGKQGWMVVVPPLPSAGAARAAAARLAANGVKDLFVIQEPGPLQHAISLGVFSSETGAMRQIAALAAQGVRNARIVVRPAGQGGKVWLRLREPGEAARRALDSARGAIAQADVRAC